MAKNEILTAEARDRAGKGAARATRRQGRIPAVIYGGKEEPTLVSFEKAEFMKAYNTGNLLRTLYDVKIGKAKTMVIPRDVQVHPVSDIPLHVDLLRLGEGAMINLDIEVHYINEEESPGLAKGGALNVVRHTVELRVPATKIPDALEADLTGLEIGDSIHISAFKLPEGCSPTITDRDFTVATIAAPTMSIEEEEEAEAAAAAALLEGEEGEGVEGEEGAEGAEEADGEGAQEAEKSED